MKHYSAGHESFRSYALVYGVACDNYAPHSQAEGPVIQKVNLTSMLQNVALLDTKYHLRMANLGMRFCEAHESKSDFKDSLEIVLLAPYSACPTTLLARLKRYAPAASRKSITENGRFDSQGKLAHNGAAAWAP